LQYLRGFPNSFLSRPLLNCHDCAKTRQFDRTSVVFRQKGEFAQHRGEHRQQYEGVGTGQFPNPIGEDSSGRPAGRYAGFPQDRPRDILDRPHLTLDRPHLTVRRAIRSERHNRDCRLLTLHLPKPACAHDLLSKKLTWALERLIGGRFLRAAIAPLE
jgi:hypothetical protein